MSAGVVYLVGAGPGDPGLVTARGQKLSARDVVSSLGRSRAGRGRAVLAPFKAVRAVRSDPLAVEVEGALPDALASALACPVTAIVPRSFNPAEPAIDLHDQLAGGFSAQRLRIAPGLVEVPRPMLVMDGQRFDRAPLERRQRPVGVSRPLEHALPGGGGFAESPFAPEEHGEAGQRAGRDLPVR